MQTTTTEEIKMHLDQYQEGNIDGNDLANAIEQIVYDITRKIR
jgi:O-phosphoseryl-tRNA(Cys) synthetase